jgi:hypothetical protein
MGNFRSGNRREKKRLVEECRRLDAIRHGAGTVEVEVLGGDALLKFGVCPQCGRACKHLYEPRGEALACRECLNLTWASNQSQGTATGQLLKNPALLNDAYRRAAGWLEDVAEGQADQREYEQAMKYITAAEGAEIVQAQTEAAALEAASGDGLRELLEAEAARLPADATLQERVIAADVVKATRLMEKIEQHIESKEENHTSRDGISSKVPMRADSFSKLGHLYIALSNLRATRAGLATQIRESRGEGSKPSMSDSLLEAMLRAGWKDKDGIPMAQLVDETPIFYGEDEPKTLGEM